MAAFRDCRAGEQHEYPPDLFGESGRLGALEALLELFHALCGELIYANRGERVDGDLDIVEALCEGERALAASNRFLRARCGPVGRREVGVCHRELAARRKALEQIDRVPSPTFRLRGSAGAPDELREPAEHVPLPEPVAEHPAALKRFLEGRDSFVVLIGQVTRVGLALQ